MLKLCERKIHRESNCTAKEKETPPVPNLISNFSRKTTGCLHKVLVVYLISSEHMLGYYRKIGQAASFSCFPVHHAKVSMSFRVT
jgi:hypothetical protein